MDNLNEIMEAIVEKNVHHFKDDLYQDLNILLDKNKETNKFIFVVRNSGTHLYEKEKLFVKNSGEREDYLYWLRHKAKVYEVEVTKRCVKNVYGRISEIYRDKLTKDIIDKSIVYDTISLKIIKKDNSEIRLNVDSNESVEQVLYDNKIQMEDVKKIYNLRYFNK